MHVSRKIHSAYIVPQSFSVLPYGNFNGNVTYEREHIFCEHEQASTHLLFARYSSKGQILNGTIRYPFICHVENKNHIESFIFTVLNFTILQDAWLSYMSFLDSNQNIFCLILSDFMNCTIACLFDEVGKVEPPLLFLAILNYYYSR